MKKLCLLTILIIFFSLLSEAQRKPDFVGQWYQRSAQGKTPLGINNLVNRAPSDFPRTKRYNLKANVNQLNSILQNAPALLNLEIPYGETTYTLNLARVELTGNNFRVRTNKGNDGYSKGVQYRGIVNNNPSHIASLSLTPGDISAYFSTNEGNFVITKEGVDLILYNDEQLQAPNMIFCQTPDNTTMEIPVTSNLITGIGCKTVNVYLECDYAFYQSRGNNVSAVADYVLAFFNQVATLYANENIAIQVSEIFVWNSPDPYQSMGSTTDVLTSFRVNRGTAFNGNLAHFLTTRNLGGGVAYVDVACNKSFAYGVSMVYGYYNNFPTYSWTVNVVAHELGHNLGSPHTHSCSWSIGALDNCYTTEGGCAAGPAPTNGGTVMSYCHLTSMGINFNNGFGFHPGNRIRDRVSSGTCITGGTAATPPIGLSTTNITSTGATLSWIASVGATNYTVQYKPTNASSWTSAGTTQNTSISISGLAGGLTYEWQVRSECSQFSQSISFNTTGSAGCAAPAGLIATDVTQTGATLSWNPVPGATGYTIQLQSGTFSPMTFNSPGTTINFSGLAEATTYTWQVKSDCSPYSPASTFTTAGTTVCSVPSNLNTTNISGSSATLSWSPVSGATGYTVQYRTSASGTWTTVNTGGTSLTINGLIEASSYSWQVKADCSPYSTVQTFNTTGTVACSAPANLTASGITTSSASLSWSPVAGATGYTVQYKPATSSSWSSVNTGSTSVNVTSLTAGISYNWQVKANCSPYSSVQNFTTTTGTTGCLAPANLSASGITTSSATLSWSPVSGATGYTVQYRPESSSSWSSVNTSSTSVDLSSLSAGTAYTWQVKASCSPYSQALSFTTGSAPPPPPPTGCATPTGLFESNITATSATLNWSAVTNAQAYNIQFREQGARRWTTYNNIRGTSYNVTRLKSRRTYEWQIETKCTDGTTSDLSAIRSFTTQ